MSSEPEFPELTASGDEEGEKTSTSGAELAAEGDDLVMERVPSAKSKAEEGSQAAEPPQTNPETGEEAAPSATEEAEGGAAEEGEEHQMTPPLPRTVSYHCVCSTTVPSDIVN